MRLSKLEKHIIATIANHIINTLECSANDGPAWEHKKQEFINVSTLYELAYSYYEPDVTQVIDWQHYGNNLNKYKSAMSRCLHNMHKKGIINALALRWIFLEGDYEDNWNWQGGGKKAKDKDTRYKTSTSTPNFKRIGLTDIGWKIARETTNNPDLGKCEHVLIDKE